MLNDDSHDTVISLMLFMTLFPQLHCCGGPKGPKDWIAEINEIPQSCCPQEPSNGTCIESNAYKDTCDKKLIDVLKGNGAILGGVGIAIAIIQVPQLSLNISGSL